MMTRKHYAVIAGLIAIAKEHHPESSEGLDAVTMMMVGAFQQDNPNFRQDLFLTAAKHSSVETAETTWAAFQRALRQEA